MADPQPVQIPALTQLTQKEAEEALRRAGLAVGSIATSSSENAPAGQVISSSPPPGEAVLPATKVDLEVSSGPAPVAVPTIVGLTQQAAEEALRNAGLILGRVRTIRSATTAKGKVSAASVVAGSRLPRGSKVDLEISDGPDEVVVPNVTGATQAAAEATLKTAGLVPGTVSRVSSATTLKGNVVATSPEAGTRVPRELTVSLDVSSTPAQIAVPNMIGRTQLAADAMLRNVGLVPGKPTTEVSSDVPPGGVSSQDPPPGTLTTAGATVNLVIAKGVKAAWAARLQAMAFTLLGLILLGIILWGLRGGDNNFLDRLAKEETARGLITFLIAITTVGIAVILAISTIALEDSPENDKRFDRGKQILTILIGVLGTIVGFYFGSARNNESTPPQAQTLSISTESLPPGASNAVYRAALQATGGTPPLTWTVSPALPAGLVLDPKTGVLSGTPTSASRTDLTFTVRDASTPAVSVPKGLTLEIK